MDQFDNNFGHDTFVVVDGRIGTPVNNPENNENWLIWFGANGIEEVEEVDAWFGEYNNAERNLSNALSYQRLQAEVARQATRLYNALQALEESRIP